MEKKEPIRRRILALRDGMAKEERDRKSGKIAEKIIRSCWYQEADILLAYVNFRSEADTGAILRQALSDGKKVYCPKVEGERMNFYQILSLDDLEEGYCGIKEPRAKEKNLFFGQKAMSGRCLMVMPGSVFDKKCNRMGYGKGYYDKYLDSLLCENPSLAYHMKLIGLCFECQMQERIPAETYDRKTDGVVTEERIYEQQSRERRL